MRVVMLMLQHAKAELKSHSHPLPFCPPALISCLPAMMMPFQEKPWLHGMENHGGCSKCA